MKPILFNIDMVRAILDGRKTVTRRVVKPIPTGDGSAPEPLITRPGYWNAFGDDFVYRQPYQPGDILYVRETFFERKGEYYYKADEKHLALNDAIGGKEFFKWHPSIHMPREAARIFLRVTGVRVERLQSSFTEPICPILELQSEGIDIGETCRECIESYSEPCCVDTVDGDGTGISECGILDEVRGEFSDLWDSTIKTANQDKYGWAANPWCWVIQFERCGKPEVNL